MGTDPATILSLARRSALATEQAEIQREALRIELCQLLHHELGRKPGQFGIEELVDELTAAAPEHRETFVTVGQILASTHLVLAAQNVSTDLRGLADRITQIWNVQVRIAVGASPGSQASLVVRIPAKLRPHAEAIQRDCEAWLHAAVGGEVGISIE
jgi:hypothetical protein